MHQPVTSLGSTMPDSDMPDTDPDIDIEELDATGLRCPLPVLKARKRLKPLANGALLRVLATDPGSPADMAAFCDSQGHTLESSSEEGGVYVFKIRKK